MVQIAILQGLQIVTVLFCAPLLRGIINRLKAIVQSKRGPSIWQPYRDLWKLLHKGSVVSEHASWVYHVAPIFSFITPLIVAMLIPVLTAYPLPYAFMGDMLAGGFILSLGGFFTSLAAMDTASAFGGMGSSRARVVSLLAEPVVILVLFSVTLIAHATIPFVVNQTLISASYLYNPAHWLLAAALFMVILAETGRIPVDNPSHYCIHCSHCRGNITAQDAGDLLRDRRHRVVDCQVALFPYPRISRRCTDPCRPGYCLILLDTHRLTGIVIC